MTSRRTKISPKNGRGLGQVTLTIFVSTVGYSSDSLASCTALSFEFTAEFHKQQLFSDSHIIRGMPSVLQALQLSDLTWLQLGVIIPERHSFVVARVYSRGCRCNRRYTVQ